MAAVYAELVVVAIAAMLSPTTLFFSVLMLVIGERPMRTVAYFYAGALVATLAVGVIARSRSEMLTHLPSPTPPRRGWRSSIG
jgi:hypothetical protein